MNNPSQIYCFRANYYRSTQFSPEFVLSPNEQSIPQWLSLDFNWRGYRIYTLPWIADTARVLGLLPIDDTPEAWIDYLESLGFQEVTPVCCEEFFEDKSDSGC